jgi:hypothetical protein
LTCQISLGAWLLGVLEKLARWSVFYNFSKVHKDDVVRQAAGLPQDVSDEHNRILRFQFQ